MRCSYAVALSSEIEASVFGPQLISVSELPHGRLNEDFLLELEVLFLFV